MKTSNFKTIAMALTLLGAASFAFSANAQQFRKKNDWNKKHPRRAEVNRRLRNQNDRVRDGREDGDLNKRQAKRIDRQDARIRREERREAARNKGHLTRVEQRKLNRQENGVSNEINRDERRDQRKEQQ